MDVLDEASGLVFVQLHGSYITNVPLSRIEYYNMRLVLAIFQGGDAVV